MIALTYYAKRISRGGRGRACQNQTHFTYQLVIMLYPLVKMAHRRLSRPISEFQNLLDKVIVLEEELNDIDLNILDSTENRKYAPLESPPKSAALRLSDVRLVFNGKIETLNAIPPPDYTGVIELTGANPMMVNNPGESCAKHDCGLFHTGKSGIAQSGDGGDGGDKWFLANDAMYRYLQKKLVFMRNEIKTRRRDGPDAPPPS